MVALVTQAQAAAHLRQDIPGSGSADEAGDAEMLADLDLKIEQASEIVIDYLKRSESSWEDPDTVPKPIQAAVLLVLTALWDDREGTGDGDYILPGGAVARLLVRFRDPALA